MDPLPQRIDAIAAAALVVLFIVFVRVARYLPRPSDWRVNRVIGSPWIVVVALACFASVNTLVFAMESPPSLGEDEHNYFAVTDYIADHGRIPRFGANEMLGTQKAQLGPDAPFFSYQSYVGRPGGPLIIAAAPLSLAKDDTVAQARAVRMPGIIYAALFVVLVFLAARSLGTGTLAALGAAAGAAFWPRVSNVLSTLNDDGFTMVCVAALVWTWSRGARGGWRDRDALLLGLILGLLLLGKPNGFFPAALSLVLLLSLRGTWRGALRAIAFCCYAAVAVAGWRYAIAYSMYGFDFFAADEFRRVEDALGIQNLPSARDTGFTSYPDYVWAYLRTTFETFLAPPGYVTVPIAHDAYVMVLALVAASTLGWISWILRRPRLRKTSFTTPPSPQSVVRTAAFLILPVALLAASSWAFYVTAVPNGKYLMPATALFLIGLFRGLDLLSGGGLRSALVITCASAAILFANIELLNEVQTLNPWGGLDKDVGWLRPLSHTLWIGMLPLTIVVWAMHLGTRGYDSSEGRSPRHDDTGVTGTGLQDSGERRAPNDLPHVSDLQSTPASVPQ